MVEQKPSKLTTRVRFPSPAPHFRGRSYICPCGSVVEHSLGKGEVTRSIRVMGTRFLLAPAMAGTCVFTFALGSGVCHGKREV